MADQDVYLHTARMGLDGRAYWQQKGRMRLPKQIANRVTALEAGATVSDMAGGRAAKPVKPIAFYDALGRPAFIVGAGVCEAAEMEDIVARESERKINVDEQAARLGMLPRDKAGAQYAEDIHDRMRQHKANWRTDPAPIHEGIRRES